MDHVDEKRVRLAPDEFRESIARINPARACQLEAEAAALRADGAQRVLVLHLGELAKKYALRGELEIDSHEGVLIGRRTKN